MLTSEIEESLSYIKTEDNADEAYVILINGKRFTTCKGKSIWKKKNHASAAFNNEIAHKVKRLVKERLIKEPDYDGRYYKNPEYAKAFEDFKNYLVNNNIMQIVKLS